METDDGVFRSVTVTGCGSWRQFSSLENREPNTDSATHALGFVHTVYVASSRGGVRRKAMCARRNCEVEGSIPSQGSCIHGCHWQTAQTICI